MYLSLSLYIFINVYIYLYFWDFPKWHPLDNLFRPRGDYGVVRFLGRSVLGPSLARPATQTHPNPLTNFSSIPEVPSAIFYIDLGDQIGLRMFRAQVSSRILWSILPQKLYYFIL